MVGCAHSYFFVQHNTHYNSTYITTQHTLLHITHYNTALIRFQNSFKVFQTFKVQNLSDLEAEPFSNQFAKTISSEMFGPKGGEGVVAGV